MKAHTDVPHLLLEIVELQCHKITAAYKLGWLSQAFYKQAIASLEHQVTRLEAA